MALFVVSSSCGMVVAPYICSRWTKRKREVVRTCSYLAFGGRLGSQWLAPSLLRRRLSISWRTCVVY